MSFDFLKRNLGVKIISLILALSIWAYVKYTSTPYASMSSEARLTIPITLEDKPENLVVLDMPQQISLIVKGAPERLAKLNHSHFRAQVNLADRKDGVHSLPVNITSPPEVKIIRTDPSKVNLRLDPLERRLMQVKIETTGSISGGMILGKMSAKPETVLISGAKSIISSVREVQAICDVDGAETDLIQRVSVEPVDETGKVLDELKVEPPKVRVTINVHREAVTATVPVLADITGSPAKGYAIEQVKLTPPTATIQFSYSLQPVPRTIKSQEISIDGATSSINRQVGIIAPHDTTLLDPRNVEVNVIIKKIENKKPESE